MSSKTKQVKPERLVRSALAAQRRATGTQRSNQIFALPDPKLDATFLAPPPPQGPADNRLLAAVKDLPLTVTLKISVDPSPIGGTDTYQLEISTDGSTWTGYKTPQPTSGMDYGDQITVEIDAVDRPGNPDGPDGAGSDVTYYIRGHYFTGLGNDPLYSLPLLFIVDLVPPGYPAPIPMPQPLINQTIIDHGLDDDYLRDVLDNKVPAIIYSYGRESPGDKIWLWVGDVRATNPIPATPAAGTTSVEYPRELIEAAGDGAGLRFWYKVEDRAGNISDFSGSVSIPVRLTPTIPNLQQPLVSVFDVKGVINYNDAKAGVTVNVPGNNEILDGNSIVVYWGDEVLDPVLVPDGYAGADPVFGPAGGIPIDYETLVAALKGAVSGTIVVKYEVKSGDQSRGFSATKDVLVDLDTVGGLDPNPGSDHSNLLPLNIQSVDLTVPPNVIPADLASRNATAIIPWKGKNNANAFKLGDIVNVYWGDKDEMILVGGPHTIDQADIDADRDLPLAVDGDMIERLGPGSIQVWYTGTRPNPSNGVSQPVNRPVEVRSAADLPGGGLPPGAPVFVNRDMTEAELYPEGVITEQEGRGGTPLEVPYYANKNEGDKIDVTVQRKIRNPPPGTPLGTAWTHTHTVGATDKDGPSTIRVGEEVFFHEEFEAGRYGRADAHYRVRSDKTTGDGILSLPEWVTINTRGVKP
ncbi:hypothetical protein [Burkholderia ubonensis]|uniref:hypothetical protein n=1 Tax=Burkholderia ubonensis TaxID=101571 RepID=UPI001160C4E1|nr:hypothetical protein [Burkholderia ubonensis]